MTDKSFIKKKKKSALLIMIMIDTSGRLTNFNGINSKDRA